MEWQSELGEEAYDRQVAHLIKNIRYEDSLIGFPRSDDNKVSTENAKL